MEEGVVCWSLGCVHARICCMASTCAGAGCCSFCNREEAAAGVSTAQLSAVILLQLLFTCGARCKAACAGNCHGYPGLFVRWGVQLQQATLCLLGPGLEATQGQTCCLAVTVVLTQRLLCGEACCCNLNLDVLAGVCGWLVGAAFAISDTACCWLPAAAVQLFKCC